MWFSSEGHSITSRSKEICGSLVNIGHLISFRSKEQAHGRTNAE